jgi:hypothetical protein
MGNLRSETAQHLAGRVDYEPVAMHFVGFGGKGFHKLVLLIR